MLASTTSPLRPAAGPSRRASNDALSSLTMRFARLMETNPEEGARMLSLVSRGLDRIGDSSLVVISRSVPSWQRRPVLPHPARVWHVSVTSATVRYSRVEYELRSDLSSFAPTGALIATGTSIVRRRYRDFVKLHQSLSRLPNVVVPGLPPKSISTMLLGRRADPEFVWTRRVGLQLWLRFVCDHHITRHTTALREFLWESETAAVSGAHFTDLTASAESTMLANALRVQTEAALILYGTNVVALTAMTSRLGPLGKSYQDSALAAQECARLDARLGRGRARLAVELTGWTEFEQGEAGQNFGFLVGFAQQIFSHTDVSNASFVFDGSTPLVTDSAAMVSFTQDEQLERGFEQAHTSTGIVEPPAMPGAALDVRSLLAFAQLIAMWGDVVFPALARLQVDPRLVRQDETSRKQAERGAAEWTESEGLRPLMVRDGAVRFVEDQLKRTQDELQRWRELEERLKSESLDFIGVLSSFESIGSCMPDLDASRLSPEKGSSTPLATVGSETSVLDPKQLDAALDRHQELFRKREAGESQEEIRARFKNPFLQSDSSGAESD